MKTATGLMISFALEVVHRNGIHISYRNSDLLADEFTKIYE
jgi:hypothetical protein